jgi:hypothetical protein
MREEVPSLLLDMRGELPERPALSGPIAIDRDIAENFDSTHLATVPQPFTANETRIAHRGSGLERRQRRGIMATWTC